MSGTSWGGHTGEKLWLNVFQWYWAIADRGTPADVEPEISALTGLSVAHVAEQRKPDFCGREGFADFELKNNNANIRRLKGRVGQFAAKELQNIARASLDLGAMRDDRDRRERLHDGSGRPLPGRAIQVAAGQPLCETPNGRIAPNLADVTCRRCLRLAMRAL